MLITTLLAMLLAYPAFIERSGREWIIVAETNTVGFYIEPSVYGYGAASGRANFWLMKDHRYNRSVPYRYELVLTYMDCRDQWMRQSTLAQYMADGSIHNTVELGNQTRVIIPGSAAEGVYRAVCYAPESSPSGGPSPTQG